MKRFFLLGVVLLTACEGTLQLQGYDGHAGASGKGGSSNASGSGGSSPGGDSGASGGTTKLEGTWNGTGSIAGKDITAVTILIAPELFSITTNKGTLVVQGGEWMISLTHEHGGISHNATARRTGPSAANLGSLPIDLSGDWEIVPADTALDQGCTTSLKPASLHGVCQGVTNLPAFLDDPSYGTVTGTRFDPRPSLFGDLGGRWELNFSKGGTCEVTFEGSSFSSTCIGVGTLSGSLHATINGALASGSTNEGLEFSARRD